MKVYLAATSGVKDCFLDGTIRPEEVYVLESFYSMQEWQKPLLNRFKSFLLDSGAFTFLNSVKSQANADFERYSDQYADFIRENHIKHYFELDIDGIVGLKEVERLRNRIEQRSGVQCIPVWHKNRGKDYFLSMCRDYKYIAIGGIVTKEISIGLYEKMFPWFISQAHKYNAKIHGLGYTRGCQTLKGGIRDFHFDSVDSTSWAKAGRWGEAWEFVVKEGRMQAHEGNITGGGKRRMKDTNVGNIHNFKEWIKFQKYANNNL